MKRIGKRYNHFYNGGSNSRGKRKLSKIHKGMNSGDVKKAFDEMNKLYVKESPFNGITEGNYAIY